MSNVTNIVCAYGLCAQGVDSDLLKEINDQCDQDSLVHVEDMSLPNGWFQNSKTLEVNLAIGAFNYLDLESWVRKIRNNISFEFYKCKFMQLMVQTQDDQGFGIINVFTSDEFEPFNGNSFERNLNHENRN